MLVDCRGDCSRRRALPFRLPIAVAAVVATMVPVCVAAQVRPNLGSTSEIAVAPAVAGLTLRQAILIGLGHAYDIRIGRERALASTEVINKEQAAFDPKFVAEVSRFQDRSRYEPLYALDLDGFNAGSKLSSGVERRIESGATVSLGYELKSTTALPTGNQLDTSYQGGLVARITQPLLKNFGPEINRARIAISLKEHEIDRSDLRDAILQTTEQLQDAFWTLHEARAVLDIRRQSLALSRELLKVKQQEVRLGALAAVQLVQIETEVANDEAELVRAQRLATDAEIRIKRLLGLVMQPEPIDLAADLDAEEAPVELAEAMARALANRAEAMKARHRIDIRQTQALLQKNQTQPDLEARLAYGYKRLGDTVGRAAPAFDNADRNNWDVGLRLTLPIDNREARAEYRKSLHELRQAELQQAQIADDIRAEVVRARKDMLASRALVDVSAAAATAHERNLDAERQKLRAGLSTIRDYLYYQNASIQARLQWVGSKITYQRALFGWHRTMAELPPHLGIDLLRAEANQDREGQ